MSSLIQGKVTKENLPIKRFGYLVAGILVLFTGIGTLAEWSFVPYLFLITMYFLTGCLWIPALIKPFYRLFGKYIIKPAPSQPSTKEYFHDN